VKEFIGRFWILGAGEHQVPLIIAAKKRMLEVITIDNKSENPGHKISHLHFSNVSITDHDKLLSLAKSFPPNAIASSASDLGARACAIISKDLGLSGPNSEAVLKLTRKDLFRELCRNLNLPCPKFCIVDFDNQTDEIPPLPVIIKPVDRSGSVCVKTIHKKSEIPNAVKAAINASICKKAIIEQKIEKCGPQICGDGFARKGRVKFNLFGDGYFHDHKFQTTPFAESFPSTHGEDIQKKIVDQLNLIFETTGYDNGPFNVDAIKTIDHEVYILDIGPRCGGNYIPELIELQTGVNLIDHYIDQCLGLDPKPFLRMYNKPKFNASYMIHWTHKPVNFKSYSIKKEFKRFILKERCFKNSGAIIEPLSDGSKSIGNLIMEFPDITTLRKFFSEKEIPVEINY